MSVIKWVSRGRRLKDPGIHFYFYVQGSALLMILKVLPFSFRNFVCAHEDSCLWTRRRYLGGSF